ncbi:helix-turn-helix domain-containing protein [Amnibacterium kyonggiense]
MTRRLEAAAAATEGDITAARIGARVAELRDGRERSVEDLAHRVGVAPAVLRDLETGRRLPTIELLYRVAAGLEVAPGELLPSTLERPRVDVHLPLMDGPGAATAQVIGGGPGNPTQTYLFDLRAGETDGGFGAHRGEELLVVVEGEVVASMLGRPDEIVRAGESRVIDTALPHAVRATAGRPARFLLVCTDACDG